MKTIFGLVLSYIIAAPLTDLISMDLRQTEWANIWTYVFWALGVPIWVFIIGGLTFLVAAVTEYLR